MTIQNQVTLSQPVGAPDMTMTDYLLHLGNKMELGSTLLGRTIPGVLHTPTAIEIAN